MCFFSATTATTAITAATAITTITTATTAAATAAATTTAAANTSTAAATINTTTAAEIADLGVVIQNLYIIYHRFLFKSMLSYLGLLYLFVVWSHLKQSFYCQPSPHYSYDICLG